MIEVSIEQKSELMTGIEEACQSMMNLKEIVMDICDESSMGERDGDEWYIRQGRSRLGERRTQASSRMGRRIGMRDYRDPIYY